MQSLFFNKINPLGICETALWAVKCRRTFIKRKTADCGVSESRRFYKERKWVTLIFWHRSGGFRPRGDRPRASSLWRRGHTLRRAVFLNLFEISITTRLLFLDLSTIYCLFCRTAIIKTDFVMKNLSKVGFCKNRKRKKADIKILLSVLAESIEKTKAPGFHESSALDLLMKIIRTGTGLHGCRFGRSQSGSGHRRNSRYRRHSR